MTNIKTVCVMETMEDRRLLSNQGWGPWEVNLTPILSSSVETVDRSNPNENNDYDYATITINRN